MHRSIVVLAVSVAFAALAPGASAQPTDCCAKPTRGLGGALTASEQTAQPPPADLAPEPACRVITITGTDDFRRRIRADLQALRATRTGARLLQALERAGQSVVIFKGTADRCWTSARRPDDADVAEGQVVDGRVQITQAGPGAASRVELDDVSEGCFPSVPTLGHELIHALHNATGTNTSDWDYRRIERGTGNHEEARTIGLGAYADDPITDNELRLDVPVPALPQRTTHTDECRDPTAPTVPAALSGVPVLSTAKGLELKPTYRAGEKLSVSMTVQFVERTLFRFGIRVVDPAGRELEEPHPQGCRDSVTANLRTQLAPDAPCGTYRILVAVEALRSSRKITEFTFEVVR